MMLRKLHRDHGEHGNLGMSNRRSFKIGDHCAALKHSIGQKLKVLKIVA